MDELIKNSINSRKDSIFTVYNVKDEKLLKEIDNLFKEMESLGAKCKDLVDFESKLASSPLSQKYIDLFAKIAQSSNSNLKDDTTIKTEVNNVIEEESSVLKNSVDDITRPARRLAREEAEKKLRSTPIIGDVMYVKQNIDLFGGFKRKKKAKEEQEKLQKELEEGK